MRKKLAVILALALALTALSGAVFAAGPETAEADVWAQSWTVDGQCAISCPDGSMQPLPEFSDLFPGVEVPGVPDAERVECAAYAVPDMDAETAAEYAYLDLDTAPEELHQKILDARNAIIFSKSWTVDGQCAISCPDGSVQPLPEFSDLFPGWDVPGVGETERAAAAAEEDAQSAAASTNAVPAASFAGTVYLRKPSDTVNTQAFYSFRSDGNRVNTIARTIPGTSYNVGYTNVTKGTSAGWATYLPLGYGLMISTASGQMYSVRASTYSTTGNATMWVQTVYG